jgi:hypothetical protein
VPQIPVGYAQVNNVIKLTGDNEEMICTMGIRLEGAVAADLQLICEDMFDAFADQFMFWVNSAYNLVRVDMYSNLGAGNVVNSSTQAQRPGLQGGAAIPQNSAYLIRKRTAVAGKQGRGRMYLPGVEESAVDALGNLTAQRITDLNVSGTNYLQRLVDNAKVGSAALLHSLVGDVPDDITTLQCDSKIATQRRRLR